MNPLTRIGYHGEKALIGIEYSLIPHEPIRIIPARFIQGRLVPEETLELESFEQLFAYLDSRPGMGIFLSIRELETLENILETGEGDIPSRVMGVAVDKPEDFAYQKIRAKNGLAISLIRKTFLEEALTQMNEYKERIIGMNMSASPLAFFIPTFQGYSDEMLYRLESGTKSYYWQGGLIQEGEHFESIYPEEIARSLGLPEAFTSLFAAMSLFYVEGISSFSGLNDLTVQRENLKKNQSIAKGLSLGILTCIALLVLGLIGYGILSISNFAMEEEIQTHGALLSKIKSQERSLSEKNSFLVKAGQKSLRPTKISYYLDRISAHVGAKLRFDKLSYQPTESELKKINLLLVEEKPDILIQGYAAESGVLASFSSKVQALDFIASVEVFESSFSFEENVQRFKVIIQLKDD